MASRHNTRNTARTTRTSRRHSRSSHNICPTYKSSQKQTNSKSTKLQNNHTRTRPQQLKTGIATIKPADTSRGVNLKKHATTITLTALLIAGGTTPTFAATVGNTGEDKVLNDTNSTVIAKKAFCGYANTGKNSKGKTVWQATGIQYNSSGDTTVTNRRYPRSPNCPLGKTYKTNDGGPPIKIWEEAVLASFDTKRWTASTSAIIWRAYYSDDKLKAGLFPEPT